jgi:hypothetical protein
MGIGGFFLGVQQTGREADHPPLDQVSRSRMAELYSQPVYAFTAVLN